MNLIGAPSLSSRQRRKVARRGWSRFPVCFGIRIEKSADHGLVRGAVLACGFLKEGDAAPTQANGHFLTILFEGKLIWRRQKICDDFDWPNGFSAVFCFRSHKLLFLSASNLRQ